MQILQLFCFLSFSTQEDDYTQKKTLVSIKVQWGGEKIYQNLQRGVYEREPWMIGERSRDLRGQRRVTVSYFLKRALSLILILNTIV